MATQSKYGRVRFVALDPSVDHKVSAQFHILFYSLLSLKVLFIISELICTPFSTHTVGQFTVLTPLGAPRGEIMLQNVFWPEIYIDITGRVFKTVRSYSLGRIHTN